MTDAMTICNWFRVQNYKDMKSNPDIQLITQMKVMKLLYYVQGFHLAYYNQTAFHEPIVAWKYGPAVKSIHYQFLGCKQLPSVDHNRKAIHDYNAVQKNPWLSESVNTVNETYGNMTASELMKRTHQELPWKRTSQSSNISIRLMKHYFCAKREMEHQKAMALSHRLDKKMNQRADSGLIHEAKNEADLQAWLRK